MISQELNADVQKLIGKLIEKSKQETNNLVPEDFLLANRERIDQYLALLINQIASRVNECVANRPELVVEEKHLRPKQTVARSGKIDRAFYRNAVKIALTGSLGDPIRMREEDVAETERQIPILNVVYAAELSPSLILQPDFKTNFLSLVAALAGLNLESLNREIEKLGFQIGQLKLELELLVMGHSGSKLVAVDFSSLSPAEALTQAFAQMQLCRGNIKSASVSSVDQVLLVDKLLSRSLNAQEAVIPIITERLLLRPGNLEKRKVILGKSVPAIFSDECGPDRRLREGVIDV